MGKNSLKNKNCLLTGATGGIGKILAERLMNLECNLFLTGKNVTNLNKFSINLNKQKQKVKIKYYPADLTNKKEIKNLIKNVRKEFSQIDILINCAGIFLIKSFEKNSLEDINKVLQVNMEAPFSLMKEFSTDMVQNKWGRIVNLGSSSSYDGFPKGSVYCLSKHAILGFSRSIHEELKSKGVRTFCISPASTKTKMAKLTKDQDYNTFLDPDDVAKFIIQTISYDGNMVANEIRLNRIEIR